MNHKLIIDVFISFKAKNHNFRSTFRPKVKTSFSLLSHNTNTQDIYVRLSVPSLFRFGICIAQWTGRAF